MIGSWTLEGILDEQAGDERKDEAEEDASCRVPVMDVIFLAEGAGRDCACCHACRDAARETGEKQCQREDEPCSRAEDGGERVCCDHGEEGIGKLILEPLLHDCLAPAFEVLALDDLGAQEEAVEHNDSTEDAHDNGAGTSGKRRRNPALGGLRPCHRDERKLCQEGEAYERDEADDQRSICR